MIRIGPTNLRDASYITANLRSQDRAEVYCQIPEGTSSAVLAQWLILNGEARIAYVKDQPAVLFGTTPMTPYCMSAWAMGTSRMTRAIDAVSRCFIDELIPARLEQGFSSMEARALATNVAARHWIEAMGGVQHGPAFLYGGGGEYFVLYRWTVASYRTINRSRWRRENVSSDRAASRQTDSAAGGARPDA